MYSNLHLRKATIEDLKLYFIWANEPIVRSNSLNSQLISWDEHQTWFKSKLTNNKSHLYILEKENNPIGQLRIDETQHNHHLINFSIDKNYRGKGYGREILKIGIEQHLKILKKEIIFLAIVKRENMASSLIFEKLGFTQSKCFALNKEMCIEYLKVVLP